MRSALVSCLTVLFFAFSGSAMAQNDQNDPLTWVINNNLGVVGGSGGGYAGGGYGGGYYGDYSSFFGYAPANKLGQALHYGSVVYGQTLDYRVVRGEQKFRLSLLHDDRERWNLERLDYRDDEAFRRQQYLKEQTYYTQREEDLARQRQKAEAVQLPPSPKEEVQAPQPPEITATLSNPNNFPIVVYDFDREIIKLGPKEEEEFIFSLSEHKLSARGFDRGKKGIEEKNLKPRLTDKGWKFIDPAKKGR